MDHHRSIPDKRTPAEKRLHTLKPFHPSALMHRIHITQPHLATRLNQTDFPVLYAIACYADWSTGRNAHPSQETIASHFGWPSRMVRRALRHLEEIGFVRREPRAHRTAKGQYVDAYHLLLPDAITSPKGGQNVPSPKGGHSVREGGTLCPRRGDTLSRDPISGSGTRILSLRSSSSEEGKQTAPVPEWATPGAIARMSWEGQTIEVELVQNDGHLVFAHPRIPGAFLNAEHWANKLEKG